VEVTVCTWDATHTLDRVEAQHEAIRTGVIKALVDKYGKNSDKIGVAMDYLKLTSVVKRGDGHLACAECGSLTDEVLSRPGIRDRLEAVRDVAQDFGGAIDRTRKARALGA